MLWRDCGSVARSNTHPNLSRISYRMADNTKRNSPEYKTLISHQQDLSLAFKHNLGSISERLISVEFITPEQGSTMRNKMHSESDRARDLVLFIQDEVQKAEDPPQKFQSFTDTLLSENRSQYGPMVKKLQKTCQEELKKSKDSVGANGCDKHTVIEQDPADVIEEFSVEMSPTQVGAWLGNHPKVAPREEFKRELSKFTAENVNGAVFKGLSQDDLKELGLTFGFRKTVGEIIRDLRNPARGRRMDVDDGTTAEDEQVDDLNGDSEGEQDDNLNPDLHDLNANDDLALHQRLQRIAES